MGAGEDSISDGGSVSLSDMVDMVELRFLVRSVLGTLEADVLLPMARPGFESPPWNLDSPREVSGQEVFSLASF